jgi:DNA-binding response OmpR family regulator
MARERILLIRSNDGINIDIAKEIEKEGYNVLLVDNIRDGLKELSGFDPHLVIVAKIRRLPKIRRKTKFNWGLVNSCLKTLTC